MTMCRIRYTRDAVDDLDSIFDYISEDNQIAATNMLGRIESLILKLANNPRMGSVLPTNDLSLIEPGYRHIVVKPYIIFYRSGKNEIIISRVLHGRQDWINLLFENDFEDS